MAVGTLVSRITGFISKVLLAAVIGFGVLNDSYTLANTLPNIIFELLIGGVLTSVVVPLLVRAKREDADGGLEYTQRLVTIATVLLVAATLATVAAAPLLAHLLQGDGSSANTALTTAFAYLLLPQIVFYGLAALFGAILNASSVFAPYAWAPVLNNVVVITTLVVFSMLPGEISLDPVRLSSTKLLVLGIGTTLGIVAQAVVLVPVLRRVGFRFRWRWGWDPRLSQAGRLMGWIVAYVAISQVGFVVISRTAAEGVPGSFAIYQYAWMLFQLPYGVLGVSLLMAIFPRMSAAAADGDTGGVVANLSLGARYSAVLLVPIAVAMTVAGESLGVALFSFGQATAEDASRLGLAVAFSAYGLLPFAVVMLQLRVFYAMADARTPTLIMLVMTTVKVPLMLACPALLSDRHIVLGLTFVNALSFLLGAVLGQVWLRLRLGGVDSARILTTIGKTVAAAVPAAAAAVGVRALLDVDGTAGAWAELVASAAVVLAVMAAGMVALRTRELAPALRPIVSRLGS